MPTDSNPKVTVNGRPVLLTKEVADLLGCTVSNVRHLVASNGIPKPVGMVGKTHAFDEQQIREWMPKRPGPGPRPRSS